MRAEEKLPKIAIFSRKLDARSLMSFLRLAKGIRAKISINSQAFSIALKKTRRIILWSENKHHLNVHNYRAEGALIFFLVNNAR